MSVPFWQLRLPECVLEMTPVDQTQQHKDANLRSILAQLHVNLGHPSNDAFDQHHETVSIQAALKVRCTVCERLTEPYPVLAASLTRSTEFGQCVALDLFMFADITGQAVCSETCWTRPVTTKFFFLMADKNHLMVFYGFLEGWCLTLGVRGTAELNGWMW